MTRTSKRRIKEYSIQERITKLETAIAGLKKEKYPKFIIQKYEKQLENLKQK